MSSVVEIIIKTIDQGGSQGAKAITSSLGDMAAKYLSVAAVAGTAYKVVSSSIKTTLDYADSVRKLSKISGESTEETSRFIQVLDDYKISTDDALAATRALTKEGHTPSIETLAKLSDQYLSLTSAEDRNQLVLKNLGRGGLQWIEVLNKGSKALLEQGDAVNKALLLSQKQVDAARANEVALDNWNDSITALKIAIGNGLLPVLTGFVNGVNEGNRAAEIMVERGLNPANKASQEYRDALKQAHEEQVAATQAMLESADAADTNGESIAELAQKEKDRADALKAMSEGNKTFLGTINDVASASKTYRDGVAEADAKLKAHDITTKDHAATIEQLSGAYEEATARIVLSLLEMKYTADGTFDNTELQKFLAAEVKLGVITEEDRKATIKLYREVDNLDDSLSTVTDKTNNYVNRVDQATDGVNGFADAQRSTGEAIRQDILPALSNTVSQFDQLPASGKHWQYTFDITTNGSVPQLPGAGEGTGGGGGGSGSGNVVEARAAGGYTSSRYVVVGDSLGGGWTPYTEVVDMQTGYVYNARDSLKLKEGGYLSGAAHMAQGSDPYESSGGSGPTKAPPFKPPTTTRTSGSRANSHGGGAADVNITVGGGADIAAEVASIAPEVSQSVAAQVSAVIAEQQAKTNKLVQQAITNKLDELIGVMLNANPRAIGTEVGYQVAKLS